MKRLLIVFSLLALVATSATGSCEKPNCCECKDYFFYIKVGSGVSVSQSPNICAPFPPWTPTQEGYNSRLGHCPVADFTVGCEFRDILDLEVSAANRSRYKYRQCQTPTSGGSPFARAFDLSINSILFNAIVIGRGYCIYWDIGCGSLYPLVGVGLGSSDLLISNYRTTGLAASGDSAPYHSFSSENQYTLHKNFTYTVLAGFEYIYCADWALSTGYRFFNAGEFKGPQYLRAANGSAVDVNCDTWNMRFRANEWFVQLKIFV